MSTVWEKNGTASGSAHSRSSSLPSSAPPASSPPAAIVLPPISSMSATSSAPPSPSPLDIDAFSPTTDMYSAATTTSASSPGSLGTAPSDDNADASIALRRQRNRESMRRTRQRAKETLTELRSTLSRLEAQYARMLAAPESSSSSSSSGADETQRRAFVERLQTRLLALVQMRRALEHENGAVRMQIEQRQALERELQQIANENPLDEMFEEKLALLGASSRGTARLDELYTPISYEHAHSVITAFCHELARVQAAAAAAPPPPPLEVFGWRTRRHVDAHTNEMHFEFTKRFDHITAIEMTQRAWEQAMDLQQYRENERELNIRRLEFLQHLSSDRKMMVRETVHPVDGTVFRTNYLVFRIPLQRGRLDGHGDGTLVGMYSLNPPPDAREPEEGAERVVWIDISVSVELVSCGPHACEVSWRGRTNYKSPQYAAENAVRFLMGVLRWEQRIAGPLITLY